MSHAHEIGRLKMSHANEIGRLNRRANGLLREGVDALRDSKKKEALTNAEIRSLKEQIEKLQIEAKESSIQLGIYKEDVRILTERKGEDGSLYLGRKWIDFEKRAPKKDQKVIVCNAGRDGVEIGYYRGKSLYYGAMCHRVMLTRNMVVPEAYLTTVTHWIPLPKAPEDNEEAKPGKTVIGSVVNG
jgi:hypothetical protein